jgi:hypothetical protein
MELPMADADVLYANIIDMGLRSELTVERLKEKALELRGEGRADVAQAMIDRALGGSALMPNLKQKLREFADEELKFD